MSDPILASTFVLTLLLLVGLFFFVRASVKDRTQEYILSSDLAGEQLMQQLRQYFTQRAYQVISVVPEDRPRSPETRDLWSQPGTITLSGQVRPSAFLAFFLSALTVSGLFCIGLVLSVVYPQLGSSSLGLALLGPAAGLFYWRGAGREERVDLRVEQTELAPRPSRVLIRAHRDEVSELQNALKLIEQD
ncbi:cofactor assembly of complex C subunit B [Leptolyngbya sp. FACHB-261]|uniref:cofactor assembly of complex C subunit B n=1 Tax=Leptolyngbya sp. FACHB-261 TaxID=2692806 RepID=UPI0016864CF5|nr:cofactor assembly of complex C subunit B [Leptolyngbya sp. FACHB-261]MBD2104386.1 cofactor assembly of complex C subunit B [Leptolyngbya sp. FACHB-261]